MQLTNLQSEKVSEIVACYGHDSIVQFKAPTGSGKTAMATSVIAQLINDYPDESFIFIIATVSTSNLPQAFESKINEYKSDLPVNDFDVEYIESPSNTKDNKTDSVPQLKIIRNKVYIFGKATFGRGRIFTEQSVITDFVQECKSRGYKIIYIRDEAHIGAKTTNDAGIKNFEDLMNDNADFVIKMTATFDKKSTIKRIELKESDLKDPLKNENKWLIKCDLHKLNDNTTSDEQLLEQAILQFKTIQQEYKSLDGVIIRPALLIQVDNEPSDIAAKALFQSGLKQIKEKLTQYGLSWVQYFGDNDKDCSNVDNKNFTLSKITRIDDTTDAIIFKIGPATGWDIPRACMLLQLRNVCSSSLNIQTIGRIKRNPYPNLVCNQITDKYYIYTNTPKDNDSDYSVYDYRVKDAFKNEQFAVIKIIKKGDNSPDLKKLKSEIDKFLTGKSNDIKFFINDCFDGNVYRERDSKLEIHSPIILLKRISVLYNNLKNEHKTVIDEIQKLYSKYFSDIKWEQLKIVLLTHFQKNISDIYKKCVPLQISYKIDLEPVNPDKYVEIFEKSDENQVNIADSNYIFDIIKNGQNTNVQQLDSAKEKVVSDALKNWFQMLPVQVWGKNQTSGNIFGEYLDDFNNNKKSYFDFVIKFINGNYLYLEVKGDDDSDIDKNKTNMLATAYKDFFDNMNYGLFMQKFVICILRVDKYNNIVPECFYDSSIIKTDLTGASLQTIIKELIK